ncbi:MAG TPA: cation:proton antiporter [Candidatus Magasanikbacteria bacterium]|nr:cation:proton antiporter [Candidatus Magasanikbacteria bacterium]
MDNIFLQVSSILAITVSVAFVIRYLRQPLIVAYIIAGILCGPMFLNLFQGDKTTYDMFSQFGVVLLLFAIGLNLNLKRLKSIGTSSILGAVGQIVFTAALGTVLLLVFKFSFLSAFILALATTFSSTIVITKLLSDKKDTETIYGKYTIGLLLIQDLIALFIMIALGFLKVGGNVSQTLVFLLAKGVWAAFFIYLLSKYFLPRFLDRISHSSELLFIFTITWCFGLASILYWLGFSVEIGAIAAGISLSSSPYQPEISSRIKPLRDFFLVLFFIVLGSGINLSSLRSVWVPGLIFSLFVLIGNPLILYLIYRGLKFTRRNSFLIGLTAAQVSEFGFVMLYSAEQLGYVHNEVVCTFTLIALVTITISSYLILFNEQIYRFFMPFFRIFGKDKHRQTGKTPALYDVWLVGYHRIGKKVGEVMKELKVKFAVIDFDPRVIREMRKTKTPSFFGDVADIEFLDDLTLPSAKMIIMTIPAVDDQINLIKHVHKYNKNILIIANAYHTYDSNALYTAGADYVMMPHVLGGNWIAEILKKQKWSKENLSILKQEQKESMMKK